MKYCGDAIFSLWVCVVLDWSLQWGSTPPPQMFQPRCEYEHRYECVRFEMLLSDMFVRKIQTLGLSQWCISLSLTTLLCNIVMVFQANNVSDWFEAHYSSTNDPNVRHNYLCSLQFNPNMVESMRQTEEKKNLHLKEITMTHRCIIKYLVHRTCQHVGVWNASVIRFCSFLGLRAAGTNNGTFQRHNASTLCFFQNCDRCVHSSQCQVESRAIASTALRWPCTDNVHLSDYLTFLCLQWKQNHRMKHEHELKSVELNRKYVLVMIFRFKQGLTAILWLTTTLTFGPIDQQVVKM